MENNNSVCFVAKIIEIKPIEGADNIELAVVGGWSCIVKKNAHTLGELVVVTTTDAIIPQELSDSLGVTNYLRKGGRVRTVKLKGVYSECLIMSKNSIPALRKYPIISEGEDLMEFLGIFKYEPPVKMVQLASGRKIRYQDNPNFHIYYKFPNMKNVPDIFNEEDQVQITRKIHGTNARYGIVKKSKISFLDRIKKFFRLADEWIDYEFVVGSHNVEKGSDSQGYYDTNVWYEVANKYKIKERLWEHVKSIGEDIGAGIVVYGEIYGAGIQTNYDYGLDDIRFVGFDISIDGKYLMTLNTEIRMAVIGLPHVEVLYRGVWNKDRQDFFVFNNFIDGTGIPHEGVVVKHVSGERNKIAKVINPDYLIYAEKKGVSDSH